MAAAKLASQKQKEQEEEKKEEDDDKEIEQVETKNIAKIEVADDFDLDDI